MRLSLLIRALFHFVMIKRSSFFVQTVATFLHPLVESHFVYSHGIFLVILKGSCKPGAATRALLS